MDERTLRWFASVSQILDASGSLVECDGLLHEVVLKGGGLDSRLKHHDHNLNSAAQIAAELEATLNEVRSMDAAYYFRYLARALDHSEKRDAILQAVAEQETALISDQAIIALGRRFVVR